MRKTKKETIDIKEYECIKEAINKHNELIQRVSDKIHCAPNYINNYLINSIISNPICFGRGIEKTLVGIIAFRWEMMLINETSKKRIKRRDVISVINDSLSLVYEVSPFGGSFLELEELLKENMITLYQVAYISKINIVRLIGHVRTVLYFDGFVEKASELPYPNFIQIWLPLASSS